MIAGPQLETYNGRTNVRLGGGKNILNKINSNTKYFKGGKIVAKRGGGIANNPLPPPLSFGPVTKAFKHF